MVLSRLFRRKLSPLELWKKRIEAFLIGSAVILFWRGIWQLTDIYLFPSNPTLSAFASLLIGMGILIVTRNFINQFLDETIDDIEDLE